MTQTKLSALKVISAYIQSQAAHNVGLFNSHIELGHTGMGSTAKQRGKAEWLLLYYRYYYYNRLRNKQKQFSNKKHSLQGRAENTDEQTVIKLLEVRNLYKLYMKNHKHSD